MSLGSLIPSTKRGREAELNVFTDQTRLLNEMLEVLRDIRASTERGIRSGAWYTNGLTSQAVNPKGTLLAITPFLQPGVYEWTLDIFNAEPAAFNYDLQLLEGDSPGQLSVTVDRSQRFGVPAATSIPTMFGYLVLRGKTVQRLALVTAAATTVAGHQGSIHLHSVR